MDPQPDKPHRSKPEEIIAAKFHARLAADLESGTTLSLPEYQSLFPGHESLIETELAKAARHSDKMSRNLYESTAHPPFRTPDRIGPFRIHRQIGEGGMGSVYLATQSEPERQVAVKVIQFGLHSREILRRFEAERQAIGRMNHAHIAKVYEAGITDTALPWFAMEYIEGKPLVEYCDANRFDTRERLRLFRKVCEGVEHAHQKAIIHRDIKPSNILVTEQDNEAVPKIIDFGLAKSIDLPLTEHSTLTLDPRRAIGTPQYMSPEQATACREIDTRADIYSLGATLYHLLVGCSPFHTELTSGSEPHQILSVITKATPRRPSDALESEGDAAPKVASERRTSPAALRRIVRGDLDRIILMCLRKEPARRYPSASSLSADILAYLEYRPVRATSPGFGYRAIRFLRRNRTAVSVATFFVATIALTLIAVNSARREALIKNESFLRMADVKRLRDRVREAEEDLWPVHPKRIEAMEAWLLKSEAMVERLAVHRASLAQLRRRSLHQPLDQLEAEGSLHTMASQNEQSLWVFRTDEDQWMHDTLASLVLSLEDFARPRTKQEPPGTLESVRERIELAQVIKRETIEAHRSRWDEAIASIRDPRESPQYEGLRIEPQVGLIPIGRDPESGLWEFGLWRHTGAIPSRDNNGQLIREGNWGIVLVLIPGGTFIMGSPESEPRRQNDEGPEHEVAIDPFFLSKYEMTQFQWISATTSNPALYSPETAVGRNLGITLAHPIESISWTSCKAILTRLGLDLPTEAQWEYAARAGTRTTWHTGRRPRSLADHGNFADRRMREAGVMPGGPFETWLDDGYILHAPVGSFRPNPMGLHDVHGNVFEWCRDRAIDYHVSVRNKDGLRVARPTTRHRIARGGSFGKVSAFARSANRDRQGQETYHPALGVRPARALEPAMAGLETGSSSPGEPSSE